MSSFSRRNIDDPSEETAHLLSRFSLFLLFVVSQIAPILARQTIYVLLPIGAALLLVAALLAPAETRASRPLGSLFKSPPLIAAALLAAWTGVSLAWTPFAGPGERFGKAAATLALVTAACAILPARTKTSNLNLLPIGAAMAAVALAAAATLTAPRYTLDDILDVGVGGRVGLGLALLVWPAMGALTVRGRWISAGVLAIATALACYLSKAPNAMPALVVGTAVAAASFGRARRVATLLAAIAAAVVLLAPLTALLVHALGGAHWPAFFKHLNFWGRMIASDGLRTVLGHGFGAATFGVLQGYLDLATPRSLVFKVWFDLGAVGALALAGVGARAILTVGAVRPALAPFLLGGLGAAVSISITGPAADQLWWLTLAGLTAIAYVVVMRGQFRKRRPIIAVGPGAAADDDASIEAEAPPP